MSVLSFIEFNHTYHEKCAPSSSVTLNGLNRLSYT